jgi:hypothetical protein
MLNSFDSLIAVIGVLIGIIAALLSILVMIQKKQFSSPNLIISLGLYDLSGAGVPRKYRKQLPSMLVIIPQKPTRHPLIFPLFVKIENRGKEALKSVRLVLEYKREYLLNNELFKSITQIEPAVLQSHQESPTTIRVESKLSEEEVKRALERREVSEFGRPRRFPMKSHSLGRVK